MKLRFFFILSSLALSLPAVPQARAELPVPGVEWQAPWVTPKDQQITGKNIEPLLKIAAQDPEVMELLKKLWERTGIDPGNAELTAALFSFCDDSQPWGEADLPHVTQVAVKEENGEVLQTIANEIYPGATLLEDRAGYQLWSTRSCAACLSPRATLRETYDSFIHEIVHIAFLAPELSAEEYLKQYPDEKTYINKRIGETGGEMQAFGRGSRAAIRASGYRQPRPSADAFFDENGRMFNNAGLRKDLLLQRGYEQSLRENYFNKLNEFLGLHALIRKLLEKNEKNIPELARLDALDTQIRSIIKKMRAESKSTD